MKKHIFLCETSHADHYQRLMEKWAFEYLLPLGFNNVYYEQSQEEIDELVKSNYETLEGYRNMTRLMQFGLNNVCEAKSGSRATILLYKEIKDLNKKGVSIQGFEGNREETFTIREKQCDSLKAEDFDSYMSFCEEKAAIDKARDKDIVKAFYNITSKNESSITMAGQAHCEDFHDDLLKHNTNISKDIQFISLGSKVTVQINQGDTPEKVLQYMCGFTPQKT